jgi:hypothetical protein
MARRSQITKDLSRVGLTTLLVRPRGHEPAYSILQRLAARAGSRSVTQFLKTVRHCPTWLEGAVRRGRDLDVVAALSGLPLASFLPHTVIATPKGTFVGDVLVATPERHLSPMPGRGRICPTCLAEDREGLAGPMEGRPYRRFWWDLPAIYGCPDHLTGLVSHCHGCGQRLDWRRPRPDLCPCGRDLTLAPVGIRAANAFDPALKDMMLGGPASAWAEGMSVSAMSGLALRVGIVDILGPHVKEVSSMAAVQRMELAGAGADMLAGGGVAAFSAMLDRSVGREGARVASPNLAYGEIQRWLARQDDDALEPYREALLEHAKAVLKPKRDVTFLGHLLSGRPRQRRRRGGMSVSAAREAYVGPAGPQVTADELALELRCSRERIVATGRMIDAGIAGLGGVGPLPTALATKVRSLLENCGTTRQVVSRLGLSQPQLVRLLAADDRDRVPKPMKGGADLFRMGPLQAFLDDATANATAYEEPPSGMVPLMKVGSLKRRWPDAYKAMRDGTLRATGTLTGRIGLNAILLSIADVRAVLSLDTGTVPTLSVSDAMLRLRLSAATLAALRQAELLVYASRPGQDRATKGPTLESVERFERRYMSVHEVAGLTGLGLRVTLALMARHSVGRVVQGGKDVQAVFARKAAMAALAAEQEDAA